MRHHRVKIAQNIASGDPERFNAMRRQRGVAPGISFRALVKPMRLAIDFDAQPRLRAVKIENVRTGRMLAAELESVRAGAKLRSQCNLGEREGAAKLARLSNCLARFAQHRAYPSTMFHMVPLPKTSVGRICSR